jgi:DNA adenine methylase
MMKLATKHEAKPFLKWAGGKGQLINQIKEFLPSEFVKSRRVEKYFEPFVGGGAVFFWLFQRYQIKKAYLYDINLDIVIAYQTIRDSVHRLIKNLRDLESEYLNLHKLERENFYYSQREEYNALIGRKRSNGFVRRTALMIFLNKTCFNGLFRVNSRGLFNVPFGRHENTTICDAENLLAVHTALGCAEIECRDFAYCLKRADNQSLIYFDPPYRPISKTAGFTGYIKNGFADEDQIRLKEVCDKLSKIGAKIILSNSDPKNIDPNDHFFDDLFKDNYKIERLIATRMINCNAKRRGMIKEILVRNYALKD